MFAELFPDVIYCWIFSITKKKISQSSEILRPVDTLSTNEHFR